MRDTRMLLAGLDQSLFQRDLLRHLRKSFDYPQNLNAFVDDLKRYMQDAKRFAELQSNIFSAILIVFVLLQLSVVFVCDSLHHWQVIVRPSTAFLSHDTLIVINLFRILVNADFKTA